MLIEAQVVLRVSETTLSTIKAIHIAKKIDYYSFSFTDFIDEVDIKYENIPKLCNKFNIKKNLIKPIYLS